MGNEGPTDRPAAAPSRRPRDLIISLVVLVVPVIILIGGYQILAGRTQPVEIDPGPELAAAQTAGVQVVTPQELAGEWVPISAVFRPAPAGAGGTVRVGYVTPDGGTVQVIQSDEPAEDVLPAELPAEAGAPAAVTVRGEDWQHYRGAGGERAMVRLTPELTVLIVGYASEAEFQELAAALPLG